MYAQAWRKGTKQLQLTEKFLKNFCVHAYDVHISIKNCAGFVYGEQIDDFHNYTRLLCGRMITV